MTAEDVVAAFALSVVPPRPTRIHKVDLVDAGAATAADRKLIEGVVDRLDWVATLSPATIGVAAGENAAAVQLLTLAARALPTNRLLTLIHRAIPLPVVLITAHGEGMRVSLAPLRTAERIGGGTVVERLVATPEFAARDTRVVAFLASLASHMLPRTDMAALYEGLVWRVEALAAAVRADVPFRLPADRAEAEARTAMLAEHDAVTAEYAKARAAARAEKALSRQVALAQSATLVKKRLDATAMALR